MKPSAIVTNKQTQKQQHKLCKRPEDGWQSVWGPWWKGRQLDDFQNVPLLVQ
jgi:hypothetical protein